MQPTINMGARPYQPALGRFLASDPIEGGTPNDYLYVADPINGSDLTGMVEWTAVSDYCHGVFRQLKCLRAIKNGNAAKVVANRLFTPGTAEWDAFKHIFWHAMNVYHGLGKKFSRGLGKAWKVRPKGEPNPSGEWDILNNEIGIKIGGAFRSGDLKAPANGYSHFLEDFVRRYVSGSAELSRPYGTPEIGRNI